MERAGEQAMKTVHFHLSIAFLACCVHHCALSVWYHGRLDAVLVRVNY